MKKKKTRRSPFEKLIFLLSAMLIGASGFMFFNIDRNQVNLQSPKNDFFAKVDDEAKKEKEQNPFVIRDGSNAMPKGMGQFEGQEQEFTPKWQKDRIKDLADRGITTDAAPAPSVSSGGGIAPAAVERAAPPEPVVEDEDANDLIPGSHSVP
ncbi:MAG: hypothetical protein Q8J63_10575 [Candidatus Aquicultor sp.]|nr:hypothetical protein [Candidatus Aquicultor sp.]